MSPQALSTLAQWVGDAAGFAVLALIVHLMVRLYIRAHRPRNDDSPGR